MLLFIPPAPKLQEKTPQDTEMVEEALYIGENKLYLEKLETVRPA